MADCEGGQRVDSQWTLDICQCKMDDDKILLVVDKSNVLCEEVDEVLIAIASLIQYWYTMIIPPHTE